MADSQLDNKTLPVKSTTADDVLDLFKSDDKNLSNNDEKTLKSKSSSKEDVENDENIKDDENDETEEEKDDDLDLVDPEDENEEKLDLNKEDDININTPPRNKELLKEFPDLFKKFPFIKNVLYRDKQYSELFGSFDDAKELAETYAEKSEIFNSFEKDLLSGNTSEILKNVKETDSKAFDKLVDNYLLNLHKADKDAYFEVVGNLNKKLIVEMVNEANSSGNDDLKQAALLLNQFLFGSSKFSPATQRVDEKDNTQKDEIEQERLSFIKERFESSLSDLQTQVDNTLRATINEYIDPRGNMSSYVKKNAVNDAIRLLNGAIASDPSVKNTLDKLWRGASNEKFSRESLARIKSFYLGKAKGNMKNAIMKARSEVLKDTNSNSSNRIKKEDDSEEIERTPRRAINPGRPTSQMNKGGMKKGESVADFFARD